MRPYLQGIAAVVMADGFLLWAMTTFQDQSFAICGKTIASLRRNVIRNLPSWIGGEFHITEQRSDNKLTVRCRRTGKVNTFYLFGGKDEASYALVQGITLAGALLDEVALMPRSFVEQVVARCSVEGSKMWFNCNPEGPEHWFYKEWVLKAQERNALHIHFTMEDNYSLSVKIKERYERMYTGVFYQRYIKGLWCVAEGLVYQLFDPKLHVVHTAPEVGRYFISVDYGTLNPFSAGLWCLRDGVATRIREYYHNGREARMDELEIDLVETSAHAGARPEHAEWQGKIFSRSGRSSRYPDFVSSTGYGTGAGLGGWNCSHSFRPYIEGFPRAYTEETLRQYEARDIDYDGKKLTEYEALQEQRGIERGIRRWKREVNALDAIGEDTSEASKHLRAWNAKQQSFLSKTGLKRNFNREQP